MAADIDVINSALSKLGEQNLVNTTDVSPAGRLATRTYADIRDALLREFPWNFALKRAAIAANAATPTWGYAYAYNLPTGCLRVVEVENAGGEEWRNEGRMIVTDIGAPLNLLYIGSVEVGEMDSTFREALAARLAMEWAEPLTQTTSVVDQMAGLYRNKLNVARSADSQTEKVRAVDANAFTDARW